MNPVNLINYNSPACRNGKSLFNRLVDFGIERPARKPVSSVEWEWLYEDAKRLHRVKAKAARFNEAQLRNLNLQWEAIMRMFRSKLNGRRNYRNPVALRRLRSVDLNVLVSRCRSYTAVLKSLGRGSNSHSVTYLRKYFIDGGISTKHFVHP